MADMEKSDAGFVMRQAEEAKKQIQLWPAEHRRTLGGEQRIFVGQAWYTDEDVRFASKFSQSLAVVAFNRKEADLLIKRFCEKMHPSWNNVVWQVQKLGSRKLSDKTLTHLKNSADVHFLDIPDEYYHVALGQALWDEEIHQEAEV